MKLRRVVEILLVEDSPSDAFLTREALKEIEGVEARLHVVNDGVEAMAFLRRQEDFADAPRPDLVLLDLNMPRKDGREVLAEVKDDPAFRRLPVIVLTSSTADVDVRDAYDLHANCYVAKPSDFVQFRAVIRAIADLWFGVALLPPP